MKKYWLHIALAVTFILFGALFFYSVNNPTPKSEKPEKTAERILKLEQQQKWKPLYNYLHPDIQEKFSKEAYIAEKSKPSDFYMKEFKIIKTEILKEWKNKNNSVTYKSVAKVSYTMILNNGVSVNETLYLAYAPDNTWRFFWWAKDNPAKDSPAK